MVELVSDSVTDRVQLSADGITNRVDFGANGIADRTSSLSESSDGRFGIGFGFGESTRVGVSFGGPSDTGRKVDTGLGDYWVRVRMLVSSHGGIGSLELGRVEVERRGHRARSEDRGSVSCSCGVNLGVMDSVGVDGVHIDYS